MKRGQIWWAELLEPSGSEPGYRRPVVIVSSNEFNDSLLQTVIVAAITSNKRLADRPGNVSLPVRGTGLPKASVVNVTQILTLDRRALGDRIGRVPDSILPRIDAGLRLALAL